MLLRVAIMLAILGLPLAAFGDDGAVASEAWVVCNLDTAALLAHSDGAKAWKNHITPEPGIGALIQASGAVLLRAEARYVAVVLGPATSLRDTSKPTSILGRIPLVRHLGAEAHLDAATVRDGVAGLQDRAALVGSRLVVLVLGARSGIDREIAASVSDAFPETVIWLREEAQWVDGTARFLPKPDALPQHEAKFEGLQRFLRLREDQALWLRHDFKAAVLAAGGPEAEWDENGHATLDAALQSVLSRQQQERWAQIPRSVRVRLAVDVFRRSRETGTPKVEAMPESGPSAHVLAGRLRLNAEEAARFQRVLAEMQEAFIALMDTPEADGGTSPLARLAAQLQVEGAEGLGDEVMDPLMQRPYAGGDGESYAAAAGRLQREALGALRDVLSREALAEFESLGLENLFEIDTGAATLQEVLSERVAALEAAPDGIDFWRELGWTASQWEKARDVLDDLKERNTAIVREAPADGGLAPLALLGEKLQAGAPDAVPAFVAYLDEATRQTGETYAAAMAREESQARQALRKVVGEEGLAQLDERFPGSLSEVPTGNDPFDAALKDFLPQ